MLGVFPPDGIPSEASLRENLSLRPDVSTRYKQQQNKGASLVDYDDEDEQLISDFQLVLDQIAQVGRQSSRRYNKVAVLLISWDHAYDNLDTEREVNRVLITMDRRSLRGI